MIKSFLFLAGTLLLLNSEAQEKFKSPKYGYSLIIPSGWRLKTQTVMPDTDAKIVDDRGNSLVVSLREMPSDYKKVSSIEILSKASDQDLIDIWFPSYDESYILKRGITVIGGREFYFAHISCPFEGNLRLIHKMFMYNWNGRSISIDCASISSFTKETSVYFDVMINTFRFGN